MQVREKGRRNGQEKEDSGKTGKGTAKRTGAAQSNRPFKAAASGRKARADKPAPAGARKPKVSLRAAPAKPVVAGKAGAGRKGKDIRSDLFVSVEAKMSGGLELDIKSKVSAFYGASIRETVSSVLRAFGVKHARVEVEDTGGLPFVIAARVETALRRTGFSGRWLPERLVRPKGPTARDRLRRSGSISRGTSPSSRSTRGSTIRTPSSSISRTRCIPTRRTRRGISSAIRSGVSISRRGTDGPDQSAAARLPGPRRDRPRIARSHPDPQGGDGRPGP